MRKIIYICDSCKAECVRSYGARAEEEKPLFLVGFYEVCGSCLEKVNKFLAGEYTNNWMVSLK